MPRPAARQAFAALLLASCSSPKPADTPHDVTAYIGTYTRGWACADAPPAACTSHGIYAAAFDTTTGALTVPRLVAQGENPSYLALAPDRQHLYAVNEVDDAGSPGTKTGSLTAYVINGDGTLREVNRVQSQGADPTHLTLSRSGRTVLAANYGGGSVIAFGVGADGRLGEGHAVAHAGTGPNRDRQQGPHAHFITQARNGRVYAADLGADKVFIYQLNDSTATLTPNSPPFATLPPGSGPRHLAFHPTKDVVYVTAELTTQVAAFTVRADGGLVPLETVSAVPPGTKDSTRLSTAAVQVTPDGRFLLATVRGANQVGVWAIGDDGRLTRVGFTPSGGSTPRELQVAPGGRFVLVGNQASNQVTIFELSATGQLKRKGGSTAVSRPVNFTFR